MMIFGMLAFAEKDIAVVDISLHFQNLKCTNAALTALAVGKHGNSGGF